MLSEMKINDYIDLLASDAPAPGGGSASALCGAQGAGLCAMVAALTLGKKKYEEHQELCRDVYEQARTLSERMCADRRGYGGVQPRFRRVQAAKGYGWGKGRAEGRHCGSYARRNDGSARYAVPRARRAGACEDAYRQKQHQLRKRYWRCGAEPGKLRTRRMAEHTY